MKPSLIVTCIAIVATAQVNCYSTASGYQGDAGSGASDYHLQGGEDASSPSAGASAKAGEVSAGYAASYSGAGYGSNQNIPSFKPANIKGNSVSSSFSYPNNKGEILIHRPAAIIVKRPPTKVVVNHPPLVVKPAPVVLHKPPAVIVRKVFVKHHPRPVKVEPVYVNVVKPPAEKYFVNEKQQPSIQAVNVNPAIGGAGADSFGVADGSNGAAGFNVAGLDAAGGNSGYQLLQNNQGLAALANLSGGSGSYTQVSGPASSSYSAPSY